MNSAFNGSATTTLYGDLQLVWRYSKIVPLLRSFQSNQSLCTLVRSVKVSTFLDVHLVNEVMALLRRKDVTFDWRPLDFSDDPEWFLQDLYDKYQMNREKSKLVELEVLLEDIIWTRGRAVEGDSALIHFLASLNNLQHLSLQNFTSTAIPNPIPEQTWLDLCGVAAGSRPLRNVSNTLRSGAAKKVGTFPSPPSTQK